MPLKSEEIQAALTSTYFGIYWGLPGAGLCPTAIIAKHRGAEFTVIQDSFDDTFPVIGWLNRKSSDLAHEAALDLVEYLKFDSVLTMYDTITKEQEKFLDRLRPAHDLMKDSGQVM